jgi:RNA-directed DNA polymerase
MVEHEQKPVRESCGRAFFPCTSRALDFSRGSRPMLLPDGKIKSGAKAGALYAFPREKSVRRFKDEIRRLTRRRAPVTTEKLIQQINPTVRGWGEYFKRAHVRLLFNQLDRWIIRRLWSHRFRHWRCAGWRS